MNNEHNSQHETCFSNHCDIFIEFLSCSQSEWVKMHQWVTETKAKV